MEQTCQFAQDPQMKTGAALRPDQQENQDYRLVVESIEIQGRGETHDCKQCLLHGRTAGMGDGTAFSHAGGMKEPIGDTLHQVLRSLVRVYRMELVGEAPDDSIQGLLASIEQNAALIEQLSDFRHAYTSSSSCTNPEAQSTGRVNMMPVPGFSNPPTTPSTSCLALSTTSSSFTTDRMVLL